MLHMCTRAVNSAPQRNNKRCLGQAIKWLHCVVIVVLSRDNETFVVPKMSFSFHKLMCSKKLKEQRWVANLTKWAATQGLQTTRGPKSYKFNVFLCTLIKFVKNLHNKGTMSTPYWLMLWPSNRDALCQNLVRIYLLAKIIKIGFRRNFIIKYFFKNSKQQLLTFGNTSIFNFISYMFHFSKETASCIARTFRQEVLFPFWLFSPFAIVEKICHECSCAVHPGKSVPQIPALLSSNNYNSAQTGNLCASESPSAIPDNAVLIIH